MKSVAERSELNERKQFIRPNSRENSAQVSKAARVGSPERAPYMRLTLDPTTPGNLCKALLDRYRCSTEFANFQLAGQLAPGSGYFRFGQRLTCYGQLASGLTTDGANGNLYDALQDVTVRNGCVALPFDPDQTIDSLRFERYVNNSKTGWDRWLKDIYYTFRPFLPVGLRKPIQRAYLKSRAEEAFPRWPVDTTIEDLCEQLMLLSMEARGVEMVPFIWFWPHGAESAVTITHDVETEKGRDFCDELMKIDESFGIQASFQIVPEERYAVSAAFIESIRKRGHEVNVQDLNHDGNLFRDLEEFKRRAQKINMYAQWFGASGFRSAVLYRNCDWWRELQFSYDMSTPNAAHFDPQQGGCCTVMPYFADEMLEIPVTTTQDYTLFHLMNDYSLDLWKMQTSQITASRGLVSFIVHPDYIIEEKARRAYLDLLGFLQGLRQKQNLWFALPGEINQWWRARQQMRVVKHGDEWKIEGAEAEYASLALAKRTGDRLAYEIAGRQSIEAR
jgi:hypothetical protein